MAEADDLYLKKGPKKLVKKHNALVDELRAARVLPGAGMIADQSPAGVMVGRVRDRIEGTFAWKIATRQKQGSPGQYECKIELESDLLKSLKPNDRQIVTGLDDWFTFFANDLIWLHLQIGEFGIIGSTIYSYGQGDEDLDPTAQAWTVGGYVEADDNDDPLSTQNVLKVMLAFAYPNAAGAPILVQAADSHFVLKIEPVIGRPALVPVSSPYRAWYIPS